MKFNFDSEYHTRAPLGSSDNGRLFDTVLSVQDTHENIIVTHPYYIRTLITGRADFGGFGYDVYPSVS